MPDRNPVIVIPGILGSKLIDRDSRRTVWGAFDRESADPTIDEGAQLLSLPVEGNRPLSELRDGVEPNGVLDKVHVNLFGIPLDIRAYVGILTRRLAQADTGTKRWDFTLSTTATITSPVSNSTMTGGVTMWRMQNG